MSLIQNLIGAGLRPHVRRKARGKSVDEVIRSLETSLADVIRPRIERVSDTPANREAVNHWIGIERWSLSRVRVALGERFVEGTYHPFRVPEGATLHELQAEFVKARAETVELAHALRSDGFDETLTIKHNDLGPLTVLEWLVYIDDHSRREVIRLR